MTNKTVTSRLHRANRTATVAALAAVTIVAWLLTMQVASTMRASSASMENGMGTATPWTSQHLWLVSAMWAAMMVGMMVPSATPMVVAFTAWASRGDKRGNQPFAVAWFVAGYLIVWVGFSLVAASIQVTLEWAGVLSGMGVISRPVLAGTVLVLAGAFQVSPWKESCLRSCRTPVGFLISEWRDGPKGAAIMGIRHGLYCLGCCWALMAVLFVVGTMSLVWMAIIAGFVLVEKIAPPWTRTRYLAAASLVAWGVWTIASTL